MSVLDSLTLEDLESDLFARSFTDYIPEAWKILLPRRQFRMNWHIGAIAEHLQAVSDGQIRKLIISVAPRHMKSLEVSVFWPTWDWTRRPERQWLTGSYGLHLAQRDTVASRRIIESPWYQARWGCQCGGRDRTHADWCKAFRLTSDQNTKTWYENDRGGRRLAAAVESGTTGEGGDILVMDDPLDIHKATSDAVRLAAKNYLDQVWAGRKNDPDKSAEVMIAQRTHEDDPTGHCLAQGGWEHLCLPTEYDPKRSVTTAIGWKDPRTRKGELLWQERFGPQEIAEAKVRLGEYGYSAQHGQAPSPPEGGIFKRAWWRFWRPKGSALPDVIDRDGNRHITVDLPALEQQILSLDCSFKDEMQAAKAGELPDPVSLGAWGRSGPDCFLLERVNRVMGIVDTCNEVLEMSQARPQAVAKLVEDKANGPAVMQLLRRKVAGLIPVTPRGSKVQRATAAPTDADRDTRAMSCTALAQAGNVYLPHPALAPWVWEYIEQLAQFPNGAHDDDVDMSSQALTFLQPWVFRHERDQEEAAKKPTATNDWLDLRRRQVAEKLASYGKKPEVTVPPRFRQAR